MGKCFGRNSCWKLYLLSRIDVTRALGPFTFTPLHISCIQLRDYVYNLFDASFYSVNIVKNLSCCKITMRSVQVCPQNSKHILKTSSLQGIATWTIICICWVPGSKTHSWNVESLNILHTTAAVLSWYSKPLYGFGFFSAIHCSVRTQC